MRMSPREVTKNAEIIKNSNMDGTKRRVVVDVLLALFGLGTWLGVNGGFLQLPLLVERLPEGWALPSWMTLAIQLGNVGIIIYEVLRRFFPRISDAPYIYTLLTIGTLALIFNAFFYAETVNIGDTDRSITFLTLIFFAALVGCTSSVVFYPYLRHFRDIYLATYLVGEGLSGFVPSILAIIQGVGGEPKCVPSPDNSTMEAIYPPARFDTTVYMLLLAALSSLSLISYTFLENCSKFDTERLIPIDVKLETNIESKSLLLQPKWIWMMVLMMWLNAIMNGLLSSIQSYSCMPYGAAMYHLTATLKAMANPVVCLAGVWLRPLPPRLLAAMLAASKISLCYILATALMSPSPPLLNQTSGDVLLVLSWLSTSAALSYVRMWVYVWARRGHARGMRICGISTQAGSVLGSLVTFLLVNYTDLFTQADVCATPISQ